MLKVAITGNIASGKSAAEDVFRKNGYKVFDTDKIAHAILDSSEKVRKEFSGCGILTGSKINRKKLGGIVFSNPQRLKTLEKIIHPEVKKEILKIFEENKKEKMVFISVPQLFESGFEKLFDRIILILSDKETRINRLKKRNNLTEEEAEKRINAQIPQEEKINRSDYVLENNSSLEEFKSKADALLADICRQI